MESDQGAFSHGRYRNLFCEYGYSEADCQKKVEDTWKRLFYGDEDTRIFYPAGKEEGYILDTGNLDVRTEGMSYGMMFCVQMDRKEEFDRIWTWTKKYMWQSAGPYAGYFAWSVNPDGTKRDQGPAPDGEEYFAMALFFASHRWGDGPAPYDYSHQARQILKVCVHKGEDGIGNSMWNRENKLIKFIPESEFTDPSYHLPHFYELFALWSDPADSGFWAEAAKASREYLKKACHPQTGLAPEYANFDGTPQHAQCHGDFYSDSYRVAGNLGLDYEWFRKDPWEREAATKIQAFFGKRGLDSMRRKYMIDGTVMEDEALHPVGLLAMNTMSSLAAEGPDVAMFLRTFWNTPVRTGKRRYYDNCLYFFSLLALTGNYRIW